MHRLLTCGQASLRRWRHEVVASSAVIVEEVAETVADLAARVVIVVAMSAVVSLHKRCSAFVVSPALWPAVVVSTFPFVS